MSRDEMVDLYRPLNDQLQRELRALGEEIEKHRKVEEVYRETLERYASGLDYGPGLAQGALRWGRITLGEAGEGEGGRGVVPGIL